MCHITRRDAQKLRTVYSVEKRLSGGKIFAVVIAERPVYKNNVIDWHMSIIDVFPIEEEDKAFALAKELRDKEWGKP